VTVLVTPPDVVTPDVAVTPEVWAEEITAAWQNQVEDIFKVGDLLVSAQEALRPGDWKAMVKARLPFNRQTAFKLQKIARDQRLRVSHGKLPAHWATLYELTRLTDAQFGAGVSSGAINARMQRNDIKALRGDQPTNRRSPNLREQLAEANREIERLRRSGGDLFGANDSPRDIATVLVNTINSPDKIERIIKACRDLLRERRRQERATRGDAVMANEQQRFININRQPDPAVATPQGGKTND
jgi:hypothetical protein